MENDKNYENNDEGLYYVPDNYSFLNMGNIGSIKARNLAEAIIVCLFAVEHLWTIPFVLQVRIAVTVTVLAILMALFITGIYGQSITQFLFNYIRSKIRGRVYLLAKPRKKSKKKIVEDDEKLERMDKYEKIKSKIGELLYK